MKSLQTRTYNPKIYKRNKLVQEYFEENNLAPQGHKRDYCRYRISKVFEPYFREQDLDFEKFIKDLKRNRKYLVMLLSTYKREQKEDSRKMALKGYYYPVEPVHNDFRDPKGTFSHISDRWTSESRVQWILDYLDYLDQ